MSKNGHDDFEEQRLLRELVRLGWEWRDRKHPEIATIVVGPTVTHWKHLEDESWLTTYNRMIEFTAELKKLR